MSTSRGAWAGGVATIALAAILASGCDALVGAACADGWETCAGRCVPSGTCSPGPDGAALDGGAHVLDADVFVDAEVADGSALDASSRPDGGDDAGGAGDAGSTDGGGGMVDGGVADGGTTDGSAGPRCDLGELDCAGVCVEGREDPAHCGGCGVVCGPDEVCAAGVCRTTCQPPLVLCGGRCIDATGDPDHCGGCGVVCASGLCIDRECSEPLAGHVVAIGHDYTSSRRGMNQLAGNAVFLARGDPVQVVVYEGGSTEASMRGTDRAIDEVATSLGRSWTRVAARAESIPYELAQADAFLVYAQDAGTDAALESLGSDLSRALTSLLRRGGVVVMFETTTAAHAGTCQILEGAGLFTCTGRADTTGSVISVVDPADPVALRVPLAYAAEATSVRFETTEENVVCSDGIGPVVVHRAVVIP